MMKKIFRKGNFIIIAIILFVIILGISIFINSNLKYVDVYRENDEILNKIRYNTSFQMIKESVDSMNKGPIPRPEKVAYITIDDGPSKYTNQILNILEENDVKATFFMIGSNMENHKKEVIDVTEKGHSVGFHSITHDIKKLYKTPQDTLDEFDKCNNIYSNITGYDSKLIRLPYGSKPYMPQESYELLDKNGYIIWDWNLDTQDWRATTNNIISNVLYYARDKRDLVLLMHEKEQTVNALDSIIKILKERGYTIIPITEKIESKNFLKKNL